MADVLKLQDYSNNISYDLLTGAIKLYSTGWYVRSTGPETWTETYTLIGEGTDASIIAAAYIIDDIIFRSNRWQENKTESESVWIWQYGDTEDAKRALIYNIEFLPVPRANLTPLLGNGGAFYQLAITRGEWEQSTESIDATATNISAYAGKINYDSAAFTGGEYARLSKMTLVGRSDSGALDRMWLGIRPVYDGYSSFDPVWGAQDAHYTDGSTGGGTVAGAYPSGVENCQVCDFTSEAYAARFWIRLDDILSSDYDHMIGEYLALARYQVTAASTEIYVGLHQGIGNYSATGPIQWVENTNSLWRFLPMGIVQIPGPSYRAAASGDNYVRNFNLVFYAGRYSGAGNLNVDSILLVPRTHFFYSEGSALTDAGTPTETILYTHEDMENEALSFDSSGYVDKVLKKETRNWKAPYKGCTLVVVGERTDRTIVDDGVDIDLSYYPRYSTHREA